jgi:hypothetical protein
MHILSHPNTLELFSFKILHPDLVQVKKDRKPYTEDIRDGFYSIRLARQLWEALISQGFERSL